MSASTADTETPEAPTVEFNGRIYAAAEIPNTGRVQNSPVPAEALAALDELTKQLGRPIDSCLIEEGVIHTRATSLNSAAKKQGIPVHFVTRNGRDEDYTNDAGEPKTRKLVDLYAQRVGQALVDDK